MTRLLFVVGVVRRSVSLFLECARFSRGSRRCWRTCATWVPQCLYKVPAACCCACVHVWRFWGHTDIAQSVTHNAHHHKHRAPQSQLLAALRSPIIAFSKMTVKLMSIKRACKRHVFRSVDRVCGHHSHRASAFFFFGGATQARNPDR